MLVSNYFKNWTFNFCFFVAAVLLCCTAMPPLANGQGLLRNLPEDGVWVEYKMDMMIDIGSTKLRSKDGIFIIKNLGSPKGKPELAQIEIVQSMEFQDKQQKHTYVIWLPRKSIGRKKDILKSIDKYWTKNDGMNQKLELMSDNERLAHFFSDPNIDTDYLMDETISTPFGKIRCQGTTGKRNLKAFVPVHLTKFEIRSGKKIPFGVARLKLATAETDEERKDGPQFKYSIELVIFKTGNNAKPSFTEAELLKAPMAKKK